MFPVRPTPSWPADWAPGGRPLPLRLRAGFLDLFSRLPALEWLAIAASPIQFDAPVGLPPAWAQLPRLAYLRLDDVAVTGGLPGE